MKLLSILFTFLLTSCASIGIGTKSNTYINNGTITVNNTSNYASLSSHGYQPKSNELSDSRLVVDFNVGALAGTGTGSGLDERYSVIEMSVGLGMLFPLVTSGIAYNSSSDVGLLPLFNVRYMLEDMGRDIVETDGSVGLRLRHKYFFVMPSIDVAIWGTITDDEQKSYEPPMPSIELSRLTFGCEIGVTGNVDPGIMEGYLKVAASPITYKNGITPVYIAFGARGLF